MLEAELNVACWRQSILHTVHTADDTRVLYKNKNYCCTYVQHTTQTYMHTHIHTHILITCSNSITMIGNFISAVEVLDQFDDICVANTPYDFHFILNNVLSAENLCSIDDL